MTPADLAVFLGALIALTVGAAISDAVTRRRTGAYTAAERAAGTSTAGRRAERRHEAPR